MSNSVAPVSSGAPSSGVPPSCMPMALNMRLRGYTEQEQEITLTGTLRPFIAEEMASVRTSLEQAAWSTRGTLIVNLKRLKYMNNVAFLELEWTPAMHDQAAVGPAQRNAAVGVARLGQAFLH